MYNKGVKIVVADVLSSISNQGNVVEDVDTVLPFMLVDIDIFPVQLKYIQANNT